MTWITVVCFISCLVQLMQVVDGGGEISVKFVRYVNPDGDGSNGHCCDGRSFFCETRGCDHYFQLCVDHFYGNDDMNACAYGKVTTGVTKDTDSITFGSKIGATSNPIVIGFSTFEMPGLRFKIDINDDDSGMNGHDHVETLSKRFVVRPVRPRAQAVHAKLQLSDRTTLTLEVAVYCNDNWYGNDCATVCRARDDFTHGHYTCNTQTGHKDCLPGWRGTSCDQQVDDCASAPCLNGALCADRHRGFGCRCRAGFRGLRCQLDVNECDRGGRCNNGVCVNTAGSFNCSCNPGYTGQLCNEAIDFCIEQPCQNNGTCQNIAGGLICKCTEGYYGSYCSQSTPCYPEACNSSSTCVNISLTEYECQEQSDQHRNNFTTICANSSNVVVNRETQNDTQSVALQDYVYDVLSLYLDSRAANTSTYNRLHNIASDSNISAIDCQCLNCDSGIELNLRHYSSNEVAMGTYGNHGNVTSVQVQLHSYRCECKLPLEINQEACDIDDATVPCHCPGSDNNVCVPYSNRCPSTVCSYSCFPVYIHQQFDNGSWYQNSHFADADDRSEGYINETEDVYNSIYDTSKHSGINSETITNSNELLEECVCMELNHDKQLSFCTLDAELTEVCSADYCKNGGTCVEQSHSTGASTVAYDSVSTTESSSQSIGYNDSTSSNISSTNESAQPATTVGSVTTSQALCICPPAFTGIYCQYDTYIDVCSSVSCQNNGTCVQYAGNSIDNYNATKRAPFICACAERFSGAYCEHEQTTNTSNKHTTDVIDKHSITKDASSALMFKGKLSEANIRDIQRTILDKLKAAGYSDDVTIQDYNIGSCSSGTEEDVSVFVFHVTVKDVQLQYKFIDSIFGDLTTEQFEHLFPVPLYTGNTCSEVQFAYVKQPKENWFAVNWYIFVVPALIFVAGVITITMLYRWRIKRRSLIVHDTAALVARGDSVSDVSSMTSRSNLDLQSKPHNYGINNTVLHPMCFRNELYVDDQNGNDFDLNMTDDPTYDCVRDRNGTDVYDYVQFPTRAVKN